MTAAVQGENDNMTSEKNIEKLKKLQALAEKGFGGEKETARKKLAQLMEKYGVTAEDLSDDIIGAYDFRYGNPFEKRLLLQIFYKVNYQREVMKYTYGKGKKSLLIFRATKEEAIQAELEYDFYRQLWDEEASFLMDCFIQKHRLFRTDPDAPTEEVDDKDMATRMLMMMGSMQDRELQKRIQAAGT